MFSQRQQNWALTSLMGRREPENTVFEERIFTALEWHNKSTAYEISEEEDLVYLAIAFEALLNLPRGEELSSRFKETIMVLLGSVPRLDNGSNNFTRHDQPWYMKEDGLMCGFMPWTSTKVN